MSRSHRLVTRFALFAALAGVACTAPSDEDTDDAASAHTAGQFVQENSTYFWGTTDWTGFRASQASLGAREFPWVSYSDPLTQRIQTWSDRFDAIVRREYSKQKNEFLIAPRPLVAVLQTRSEFNAWVSAMPVDLGVGLGKDAVAGSSTVVWGNDAWALAPNAAATTPPSDWTVDGYLALTSKANPGCALRRSATGLELVAGPTCVTDPAASSAERTVVLSTAPYVQFTTDLLAEVSEATLAAVIAHELGHFFLGHANAVSRARYGFWYSAGQAGARTPARAPGSEALEATYKEVAGLTSAPRFGKKYSPRMRAFLVGGLAPLLAERTEADFACAKARDAVGAWTTTVLGEAAQLEDRTAYETYEAAVAECAPRIRLGSSGAAGLSAGEVLFAAGRHRPGTKVKPTLKLGDTLADFIGRLETAARDLDAKADALVKRARTNDLGLFTTEQHADDVMLELMTKAGFTANEVLDAWVGFMKATDRVYARMYTAEQLDAWRAQTGEVTAERCEAMMRAGFREGGQAVTVSLGDLGDSHHSSCYRLFNLYREARTHAFRPGPKAERLDAAAWEALRVHAEELRDSAPLPASE